MKISCESYHCCALCTGTMFHFINSLIQHCTSYPQPGITITGATGYGTVSICSLIMVDQFISITFYASYAFHFAAGLGRLKPVGAKPVRSNKGSARPCNKGYAIFLWNNTGRSVPCCKIIRIFFRNPVCTMFQLRPASVSCGCR